MALFIDGPVSTIEDLAGQDSQLLDVANIEGIDLTRKLALAQEELALEVQTLLSRLRMSGQALWTGGAPDLRNVVVTSSLKLWHTFRTLEMVYRDAYNNQLNDRYAGKRDAFRDMAKWAFEKLIQSGIGMASDPMPRAERPTLVPGPGTLPDGIYYVSIAWVNGAGDEGEPSIPETISLSGSSVTVRPPNPPVNAMGWNVYIGIAPETMVLQNGLPITAGQNWTQTEPLAVAGRTAGAGQLPDYVQLVPRLIQRG